VTDLSFVLACLVEYRSFSTWPARLKVANRVLYVNKTRKIGFVLIVVVICAPLIKTLVFLGDKTMICPKCGNKVLLGMTYIEYILPDQEPYESDKIENIDEIYDINIPVDVHWCENCQKLVDVEIDEEYLITKTNKALKSENQG
jgi:hypothetical protein